MFVSVSVSNIITISNTGCERVNKNITICAHASDNVMFVGILVIRKYGSTFYIGIAMVVLPYFGLWEN